ncbi:hypothetical protein VEE57_45420 (plasmid) [Escherichia coli]|nr:hypothetical protein VEE57_45420 [Escherichia coli]
MESNSPDIDFIELFLFLKKKIVSIILFVVFIDFVIYFLADKQKQNKYKVRIKYDR